MRRTSMLLTALALTTLAACAGAEPTPPSKAPRTGDSAPRFTLPAADGTSVGLAGFSGRPVLLYFSMGPG